MPLTDREREMLNQVNGMGSVEEPVLLLKKPNKKSSAILTTEKGDEIRKTNSGYDVNRVVSQDPAGNKQWESYSFSTYDEAQTFLRTGLTTRQIASKKEMEKRKQLYGAPKITEKVEGKELEFTLPEGGRETYTPEGSLISKQFALEFGNRYGEFEKGRLKALRGIRQIVAKNEPVPENYKQLYSPQDQQLIEQYEAKRSQIANDPELEESERQALYDKIDARISAIPHISPQMQETTPQQKAESQIVKINGNQYFYDGKSLKPLESDVMVQKQQEEYNKRYQKNLDELRKINNDRMSLANSGRKKKDEPHLIEEAMAMTDIEVGRIPAHPKSEYPELDANFISSMENLNIEQKKIKGKPSVQPDTKSLITTEMMKYVVASMDTVKGLSESEAKADFLQRYLNELGGGAYQSKIPEMTPDMTNEAMTTIASRIRSKHPVYSQFGVGQPEQQRVYHVGEVGPDGKMIGAFAGGEIPTAQNTGQQTQTQIPKGLEPYWDSMSEEEKQTVLQYLAKGGNINEVIKRAKK